MINQCIPLDLCYVQSHGYFSQIDTTKHIFYVLSDIKMYFTDF